MLCFSLFFIHDIVVEAQDEVLYCLCKSPWDGQAMVCYKYLFESYS